MIIVSATNRQQALTYTIAQYYQSLLETKGQKSEIMNLHLLPEDFAFSALYDNAGKNQVFNRFQEMVDQHEKFVFIVPEYNGSFPGVLKTFIDGLRYPDSFENKKAALVGLSAGIQGGALALSHLNDILNYMNMDVLCQRVKLFQINKNMEGDQVSHPLFNELLNQQMDRFIRF